MADQLKAIFFSLEAAFVAEAASSKQECMSLAEGIFGLHRNVSVEQRGSILQVKDSRRDAEEIDSQSTCYILEVNNTWQGMCVGNGLHSYPPSEQNYELVGTVKKPTASLVCEARPFLELADVLNGMKK